jgi:tetratricopeptide (TPR) repeat protein
VAEREVLDSWKAIAVYLKRDIRTCQRYERKYKLPIHRLDDSPRARVYAYKDDIDAWRAKEDPPNEPLIDRIFTYIRTNKRLFAILLLSIAAIVTAKIFIPSKDDAPERIGGKPNVAILPFHNLSGLSGLDAWERALAELLYAKFFPSRFIDVVDTTVITGVLRRSELDDSTDFSSSDLIRISKEVRATHALNGSLMKAGDRLVLTFVLHSSDEGQVAGTVQVDCAGEEGILGKMDEAVSRLKSVLKMTPDQIAAELSRVEGKVTTTSVAAFKQYSLGRGLIASGRYAEAIASLEKAVAIDPEFASAYRSLGAVYKTLEDRGKARFYCRSALELSDRVSEREKLLIQGDYYTEWERTWYKALDALTKLAAIYPNDIFCNINLANLYNVLDEVEKAIERAEYNRRIGAPGLPSYRNLSQFYSRIGAYDKALEVLDYFRENFADSSRLRMSYARVRFWRGEYDLAIDEANKALALEPANYDAMRHRATAELLKGDLQAAKTTLRQVISSRDRLRINAGYLLSCVFLYEGLFKKSVDEVRRILEEMRGAPGVSTELELVARGFLTKRLLRSRDWSSTVIETHELYNAAEKADDLGFQRSALWRKGLAYVGLNSIELAQKTAEELLGLQTKTIYKKAKRYYCHLQGCIELQKENFSSSIGYFQEALSFLPEPNDSLGDSALFLEGLGLAHFRAGDLANAQKAYEKIRKLTFGRVEAGDVYVKSFYMLGLIAEKQGDKVRARENFQEFLRFWRAADPGIPEIEDAKRRLEKL